LKGKKKVYYYEQAAEVKNTCHMLPVLKLFDDTTPLE